MFKIPIPVINIIQDFGNTRSQVTFNTISKLFHKNVHITRLVNIRFTNKIIKQYNHIKHLRCGGNYITDNGIKHCKLISLAVGFKSKITDKSINKQLNLQSLDINACSNITNEGIKNLQLRSLAIGCNKGITDEGIKKQTNLTDLNMSYNDQITDDGIKDLQLKILNVTSNKNITDKGIKDLPLHTLYIDSLSKITDDGLISIKNTLRYLDIFENKKITIDCIKQLNLDSLTVICGSHIRKEDIKDVKIRNFEYVHVEEVD